jgi:hypothetical protein
MSKLIACVVALVFLVGCGDKVQQQGPARPKTAKDPKIAAIEERIAKTSEEGKQMVEKIRAMKPEVNGQPSAKPLGEIIDDYAQNKGAYNITPLGWEASLKATNQRWKLVFNYKTYSDEILAAEWEYDPKEGKLYPFDLKNAPTFWTAGGGDAKGQEKKGK